jgi:hypothetical protein
MLRARPVVALLVFVAAPAMLRAQGEPLGPEFRVNTYTTNGQFAGGAASDVAGNFVVVWSSSDQDGSLTGVFGQRYAGAGPPLGGEFRVNTYTTGFQAAASVASDSAGNFVVVWSSLGQDAGTEGVFGQRYAATGVPLGGEFRVNTYTTGEQGRRVRPGRQLRRGVMEPTTGWQRRRRHFRPAVRQYGNPTGR